MRVRLQPPRVDYEVRVGISVAKLMQSLNPPEAQTLGSSIFSLDRMCDSDIKTWILQFQGQKVVSLFSVNCMRCVSSGYRCLYKSGLPEDYSTLDT